MNAELINELKDSWAYGLLLLQRIYKPILAKYGVTPAEKRILYGLSKHQELSKQDLAKAVVLEPSAITRAMQRLENNKDIKRHVDVNDKRSILLMLTPKGRKKIEIIQKEFLDVFKLACHDINDDDIINLAHTLEKLNQKLTNLLEEAS